MIAAQNATLADDMRIRIFNSIGTATSNDIVETAGRFQDPHIDANASGRQELLEDLINQYI